MSFESASSTVQVHASPPTPSHRHFRNVLLLRPNKALKSSLWMRFVATPRDVLIVVRSASLSEVGQLKHRAFLQIR
jgi:hypothetical protein